MSPDTKLRDLLSISAQTYTIEISPWALEPTKAFVDAGKRLSALIYLYPSAMHATIVQERLLTEAIFEVTGDCKQPGTDDPRLLEIIAAAEKKFSNEALDLINHPSIMEDAISRWEQGQYIPQIAGGLQSFMASILNTAWTTFEILAGDLWVSALNHHPHLLSDLAGRKSRISDLVFGKSARSPEQGSAYSADKTIPLGLVQMYSYNLSKSMGSILRKGQSFDRLDGIRTAYSLAFSIESDQIDEVLARLEIDSLNALRNLLAHQGGKVDNTYLRRVSKLPLCPNGAIGSHIFLDGEIVSKLVLTVTTAGYNLIEAVNAWMVAHPNKLRESEAT